LHAKQQGSVHWYASDSLAELLKGRPPLSVQGEAASKVAERSRTDSASGMPEESGSSNVAVLDEVDAPPPPFGMDLVYNKIIDERQILSNVRRALSTELVADVLINGRSWDEATSG
jgi:hypothetical protein